MVVIPKRYYRTRSNDIVYIAACIIDSGFANTNQLDYWIGWVAASDENETTGTVSYAKDGCYLKLHKHDLDLIEDLGESLCY